MYGWGSGRVNRWVSEWVGERVDGYVIEYVSERAGGYVCYSAWVSQCVGG